MYKTDKAIKGPVLKEVPLCFSASFSQKITIIITVIIIIIIMLKIIKSLKTSKH